MALAPLATSADLLARGIALDSPEVANALLAAASESIRSAAGVAISRTVSEISIEGTSEQWLPVPLSPVYSVVDVAIDDVPVSEARLIDGRLWRARGWRMSGAPSLVSMTVDHGYDPIPADIVDLCCSLVGAGAAAIEEGYDPQRGLISFSIDDYREGYAQGDAEVVNPMELPARTRLWLRQRFGGAVAVIGTY